MKVAVTGASGNVGTALLRALEADPQIDEVTAIARRQPAPEVVGASPKVTWHTADLVTSPLEDALRGAAAVVHLAWLLQPTHRPQVLHRNNVEGSRRVLAAAAAAGVPAVVHASSVGAYSPGPKDTFVDESWPVGGLPTSTYSQDKAAVERLLDDFEADHPGIRVVRLRPGIILQRAAASELARLFLGPLVPVRLLRPGWVPVVPDIDGLRIQALHSDDVAEAYRLAVVGEAHGPFNVAADPVLDPASLASALGARRLPLPRAAVRSLADLTWRLHLQPTSVGWLDLALQTPLLDTGRIRRELGWAPRWQATDAVRDVLAGFGAGASGPTPPLAAGHRIGAADASAPGAPSARE